jgi:hypothetical protein
LGGCITEITCSAVAWGLPCLFTPKAKVKVTITVSEYRERLIKGSIQAGLFAQDIVINADFHYTGDINNALSDQEISDQTQNTGQDDLPKVPEGGGKSH